MKVLLEMVSDVPETEHVSLSPKEVLDQLDRQVTILSTRLQGLLRMRDKLATVMVNTQMCRRISMIAFSNQRCEQSMTGKCVYDQEQDPGHHNCLFCQEKEK